jgi:ABC-type polysaccharide transport system permease subunit
MIDSVILNELMVLNKESPICFIECEEWWKAIVVRILGKNIEQHVIPFVYVKMHPFSHKL